MRIEKSSFLEALASVNDGLSAAYVALRRGGASKKAAREFIQGVIEQIPDRNFKWEESMLRGTESFEAPTSQHFGFHAGR